LDQEESGNPASSTRQTTFGAKKVGDHHRVQCYQHFFAKMFAHFESKLRNTFAKIMYKQKHKIDHL
jgi:hypothetical protein